MKLVWDQIGERTYETGIKKMALYLYNNNTKAYDSGVAWSGITSLSESPSGADANKLYADDINYLTLYSVEELGLNISAYTYPQEFEKCDGTEEVAPGVNIYQQDRTSFGLAYVTTKGNDTKGNSYGYLLHMVWGCRASVSDRQYNSINDSPEAIEFSWEVTTTPVNVEGYKPTARFTVDSSKVNATNLAKLESILFGTDTDNPRLPMPDEVISIMKELDLNIVPVTDNTQNLKGKTCDDLMTNVSIASNGSVTGTLKYVTDYTGFSEESTQQSGNYIAIKVTGVEGSTLVAKIEGEEATQQTLDPDGIYIARITSKDKVVTITETLDATVTVKAITFLGVTLATA